MARTANAIPERRPLGDNSRVVVVVCYVMSTSTHTSMIEVCVEASDDRGYLGTRVPADMG